MKDPALAINILKCLLPTADFDLDSTDLDVYITKAFKYSDQIIDRITADSEYQQILKKQQAQIAQQAQTAPAKPKIVTPEPEKV